jgi:hypothetical protein
MPSEPKSFTTTRVARRSPAGEQRVDERRLPEPRKPETTTWECVAVVVHDEETARVRARNGPPQPTGEGYDDGHPNAPDRCRYVVVDLTRVLAGPYRTMLPPTARA